MSKSEKLTKNKETQKQKSLKIERICESFLRRRRQSIKNSNKIQKEIDKLIKKKLSMSIESKNTNEESLIDDCKKEGIKISTIRKILNDN